MPEEPRDGVSRESRRESVGRERMASVVEAGEGLGEDAPWVAALHPVNGLLILGLASFLAHGV